VTDPTSVADRGDRAAEPERVAVVGAGAVGLTAALDLARAGVAVSVFDRGRVGDGTGASGRAAGLCYDAYAGPADAEVAARALERLRAFAAGAGSDTDGAFALRDCPYVWLARTGDDRRTAAIREQVSRMRAAGRAVECCSPDALAEQFPAVRADDVAVAAVARDACRVDPAAYTRFVAERARRAGATVHEDTPVALDRDGDRPTVRAVDGARDATRLPLSADAVLVAAGAHTGGLLDAAGVAVPVVPYRVQATVGRLDGRPTDATAVGGDAVQYAADATAVTDRAYDGPMVYDATDGFYCRPHPAGVLAGNGTEERAADPDAYDRAADEGFATTLAERVGHRLDAAVTPERTWAGLCTATPDRDPLLGRVRSGVYVATGWQGSGFMRAPATGEAVARAILRGERAPVAPYDPARFDGDEPVDVREGMLVED
jgi:glycine/D-amino acid oxidase-like deaminating enzyme